MEPLQYQKSGNNAVVTLRGYIDKNNTQTLWEQSVKQVETDKPASLVIDASQAEYFDAAGLSLILKLQSIGQKHNIHIDVRGLDPKFQRLLAMQDPGPPPPLQTRIKAWRKMFTDIGMGMVRTTEGWAVKIRFLGELTAKFSNVVIRPGSMRWRDMFLAAEKAGANAVGITSLLGLLIGLILAFQSAIAMKQFGAEIYVANLVALSVFRELGPLITAFILAARSGSAFAAEIGTMKINEEIDALSTMGIDPVRFLVLPRVLGATIVLPLLTMFNNFFAMLGAGIVMIAIGFAPITFYNQVQNSVGLGDIFGGLAKTFVFGFLIASIGCLRGMGTGTGASAVGDSATRAVVSGIIAIVLADGVFAVLYYFLGI